MEFIIFGVFIIILGVFLEKYLIKKYDIEKNKGFFNYVNKNHMWGEYILLAIGIVLIVFLTTRGSRRSDGYLILIIIVYILRSIMQWRYEREKKGYILTAMGIAMLIALLVGANIFLP